MSAPSATVTNRGQARVAANATSPGTASLHAVSLHTVSLHAASRDAVSRDAVSRDAAPRDEPRQTRLRITRRGRAVLTGLVAVPVVAAALLFASNGGGAMADNASRSQAAVFDYVTVQAGQSMWELAESVAPSADPRDVIAAMMALNGLETTSVLPGQLLAIPATYAQ